MMTMLQAGGIAGCGSSESQQGGSSPPSISAIGGDGSSGNRFQSSMIVTGENFTDDMSVELHSKDSDESFDLSYSLNSPTQVTVSLPASLAAGEYELIITKDTGSAIAAVTILQGETGPQGPAGIGGITIAAQFSCGSSGDLDPTSDDRKGIGTDVVEFSDGSSFITCVVDFLSGSFLYFDTSSYSAWFAADSTGVAVGLISCIPFYVTVHYSIPGNTVTYVNQADSSQTQTVACTQTYP
jgi:hypothetical protein